MKDLKLTWKRMLSLCLAMALLFSVTPSSAFWASAQDEQLPTIALDEEIVVTITSWQDYPSYLFVPEETALYKFSVYNASDGMYSGTHIFDENGEDMSWDDSSYDYGKNYAVFRHLNAGEQYGIEMFCPEGVMSASGTYCVKLEKLPTIVLDKEEIVTVASGECYPYFVFVPEVTDGYTITIGNTEGEYDIYTGFFDENNETICWGSNDNGEDVFTVSGLLKAGERYYVELFCPSNDASQSVTYSIKVEAKGRVPATEIHIDPQRMSINEVQGGWAEVVFAPENALQEGVTWTSSDPSVVAIDDTDTTDSYAGLQFVSVGTATITATSESGLTDTATVFAKEVECIVLDEVKTGKVANDETDNSVFKFIPDETATYRISTYNYMGEGALCTYVTGFSEYYGFYEEFQMEMQAGMDYYIHTYDFFGDEGSYKLCVTKLVTATDMNITTEDSLSSYVGDRGDLYTVFSPDNAGEEVVTWASSNPEVVYVEEDENGTHAEFVFAGIGTATITATSENGLTDSVEVTCLPSPIDSLYIAPLSISMETNGYWTSDYNAETGDYVEYYYYDDYAFKQALEYMVTWNDGAQMGGAGEYIQYQNKWYEFRIESEQSCENPWLPGNTYPITVSVMGSSVETTVTIENSPIASIVIEPVSIFAGTNGEWMDEIWVTNEYYHYYPEEVMTYTVTWNDGTETTGTVSDGIYYNDEYYSFEIDSDQSDMSPWQVGNTYSATVSLMGVLVEVPVTITESPVRSVEIAPVSIIEETGGYWEEYDDGERYYCYEPSMKYTVTWADGTTSTGDVSDGVYYNEEWYSFDVTTNQSYNNPWQGGNTYTITVRLMGVLVEVPVTIEHTPIETIYAAPITVYQGIDSSLWEYEHYFLSVPAFTVQWKDGSTTVHTDGYVDYMGTRYYAECADNQSASSPWTPNNSYMGEVRLMGVRAEVAVRVEPSLIKEIEVVKAPDKSCYEIGEYIDLQGTVLRVRYTDDTYEDVTLTRGYPFVPEILYESGELQKIGRNVRVRLSDFYANTSNLCRIDFLDKSVDIPITVSDRETQEVAIRNEGANLYITVTYKNGEQKEFKALGLDARMGDGNEEIMMKGGDFFTDNGVFFACVYQNIQTKEVWLEWQGVRSNSLDSCLWWELRDRITRIATGVSLQLSDTVTYDGVATPDNIDELIAVMCSVTDLYVDLSAVVGETAEGVVLRADSVKVGFYELYGIMPDLTMSDMYDKTAKTVTVAMQYGLSDFSCLYDIEQTEQGVTVRMESYAGDILTFTLDSALYLHSFVYEKNSGIGNINQDGEADLFDATRLFYHINGKNTLTEKELSVADVDGNGIVNLYDVARIFYFINGLISEL